jgi:hypothetical protein
VPRPPTGIIGAGWEFLYESGGLKARNRLAEAAASGDFEADRRGSGIRCTRASHPAAGSSPSPRRTRNESPAQRPGRRAAARAQVVRC